MNFFPFPGFLLEDNTTDTYFEFPNLKPYTKYIVIVRAKAAGELGPAAEKHLITPAEGEKNVNVSNSDENDLCCMLEMCI